MVGLPLPMMLMLEPRSSSNSSNILHSTLDLQQPKPLMPERLSVSESNEGLTLTLLDHLNLRATPMVTCLRRARGRQCRASICHRSIQRMCLLLFAIQLDPSVERFMRQRLTIENGKMLLINSRSSAKTAT